MPERIAILLLILLLFYQFVGKLFVYAGFFTLSERCLLINNPDVSQPISKGVVPAFRNRGMTGEAWRALLRSVALIVEPGLESLKSL
ncbi:hypothetical protein SPRA44_140144 [Serratia proteamaculans]|nr:hypothetical protein SPRA44_140144 [Serratia proteamaculans]